MFFLIIFFFDFIYDVLKYVFELGDNFVGGRVGRFVKVDDIVGDVGFDIVFVGGIIIGDGSLMVGVDEYVVVVF